MPPAKSPPSCGASGSPPPLSLLLRTRFTSPPAGIDGAPPGGLSKLGIGGAPPTGAVVEPPLFPSMAGAERSFVTAFFNRVPLLMSESRAP